MIKFGPSGFCEDFASEYKSTEEMPKWLLNHNLKCYELSFTNGVRLSLETAEKYGKHHIAIAGVVGGMAIMGISLLLI